MSINDENVKFTFRDTIGLFVYGCKFVYKMAPSYFPYTLLRSLITAAQPMLALFFSARILNELNGVRDVSLIVTYVVMTVGLTFVISVLKALLSREVETYTSWERLYAKLQLIQAERFVRMDFAHTEDSINSEVLARMDAQAISGGLGVLNIFYYTIPFTESFFSLIFAILLLARLSVGGSNFGWYSLVLYALFALGLLFSIRYNAREKDYLERIFSESSMANITATYYGKYVNADEAAKDVRLYDQSGTIYEILKESLNTKAWMPLFFFEGRQQGFFLALLAFISGGFYLLSGLSALEGSVSIGGIVQIVGSISILGNAIGTLLNTLGKLWNNAAYIKPMREFMTLPNLLRRGTKPIPTISKYHLEFRGVSFRYPNKKDYAIRNLNMTINPGERLAVVGLNGSGKTTMVKLLCRLYDPTEGEILLNGTNIKEYNYEEYIALFSVVFQDFTLFPLWLGQNVAARKQYDEKRVGLCLDNAGFARRLETMPDGLDTVLYKTFDENGIDVSSGEAQKIALARALYNDTPLIILDEPTASLDPIAEYEVYTSFNKTIGEKTAVFISHRLSSCRFCHRVAVFDDSRLVELGTHECLLADASGRYHELWETQAYYYR